MRILLVTHLYPPHHQAGVEQYTRTLANALKGADDVSVATTRKILSRRTGFVNRVRDDEGVSVHEFVANHDFGTRSETYLNSDMERGLLALVEERNIDIVHFQHLMYWSTGLVKKLAERGVPIFLTLHDYWLMCGRMGQLRRASGELCEQAEPGACCECLAGYAFGQPPLAIQGIAMLTAIRRRCGIPLDGVLRGLRRVGGWFSRGRGASSDAESTAPPLPRSEFDQRRAAFLDAVQWASSVLVPTQTFREAFLNWGISDSRLKHVAHGRDHAPFENLVRMPRGDGPLRVGFIGQVAEHKGVRELIDAVLRIDPAQVDLQIIGPVVGDRAYAAACRAAAEATPNIHYRGAIAAESIPDTYQSLDVLVVPSLWNECSPLTIQEAFMSGVPVIASDIGGMREMVEPEVSGLLVKEGDVDGLASALQRLVDDEPFRQTLADGVPNVCSLQDHVRELRGLYSKALGAS